MPYVYEVSGRYVCLTTYEDRKIAEEAGFQFSKTVSDPRPVWWTNRPEVAYRLLEYCEASLRDTLEEKFKSWPDASESRYVELSRLMYSPRYRAEDYQIAGARHILGRKYSYLWFEAGTGKTFTATLALEFITNTTRKTNVVICPSFLKYTWREEIDDKSFGFLDVLIINSAKDILRNADIVIIPDSLIGKYTITEQLLNLNLGLVVVDEGHRFKNEESGRCKLLTSRINLDHTWLGSQAEHVCVMSGTPMPNYKPIELWPIINAFAPQALGFMSKYEYGRRYCESVTDEYGTSYGGAANLEDLISRLKSSGYVLHQELREGDVPPQASDTIIYLDPNEESRKVQKAQEQLMKTLPLEEILKIACGESSKIDAKVRFKSQFSDVSPKDFIAELRKLAGEQAAEVCTPILKDIVKTGGEPIVVFAWHKTVITKLKIGLAEFNPLVIDGATPMSERQNIVNEYQNGNGKVIILNIVAGGLGFTLTKASKVYFVEFDWVEGNNDQCVRRLRRKGQTKVVEPYYFVFKNSLAHLMLGVLGKKTKNKTAVNAALLKE